MPENQGEKQGTKPYLPSIRVKQLAGESQVLPITHTTLFPLGDLFDSSQVSEERFCWSLQETSVPAVKPADS